MKITIKNSIFILLLLLLPCLALNGQINLKKTSKQVSVSQQGQNQVANIPQVNTTNSILQNFNNFLSRTSKQKNASYRTTVTTSSSGISVNKKLPLPSINSSGNQQIERILWNSESGTPRLIEMKKLVSANQVKVLSEVEKKNTAAGFLLENKSILKISDPQNELVLKETKADDLNFTNLRYSQYYRGIEVWGREFIIHFDASGNLVSANGAIEPTPAKIKDVVESVSSFNAIETAKKNINQVSPITPIPDGMENILDYKGPVAKKVIWFDEKKNPYLTWVVEVRSGLSQDWFYFIDAHTGNILNSYNAVCYDGITTASGKDLNGVTRTFGAYQVGANYFMIDASQPMFNAAQSKVPDDPVGAIVGLDLRNKDFNNSSSIYYSTSSNNQWNDPAAISAHYNGIVTYKYFLNTHKRNSVDDKGMTIYSIVHVTDQSKPMENAFWSGKVMCYGDGGSYFTPLAGGLDVAAHEMTHGITQFSANLEYQGQSGALNESMSDAFGALVDTLNWKIGEQIIKDLNTFPSGAMRDMIDPHNGGTKGSATWQPAKMSEFLNTTEDNGGVHSNSGIPNRAFYLVAKSLTRAKAAKIWYRALTIYLTRTSQFIDARIATVKSATDLYGESSAEVASVKNAWDTVEVLDGNATPNAPTSTLSGSEYILVTNTDPADPNSIYMAKTIVNTAADFFALSKTPVLNKPAVSDVSGVILFIDKSNNLRLLSANPNNPQESVLDNSGVWESAAIGPGLNSMALTSKYIDTTIYYFDFTKNISKEFKIATKTFDAVDKKTALYADALSFDPTGRYILFDAYNEIKNANGDKISFWNINILDVQTGNMDVIFPPLAEGLSVGNPAFSKTVQTRFTFDYIDSKNNQAYVMAADFNTGDVGTVAGPLSVIGYPSYSIDDKMIIYHTSQVYNGVDHHTLEQMPLKANFIEGTGNKQLYLIDANYPIWFVIGTRTDVDDQAENIPSSLELSQNYPNPFNPETTINYTIPSNVNGEMVNVTLKVYDVLGREVATLVDEYKQPGNYNCKLKIENGELPSGVYFYRLQSGSYSETKKLVLMK